MSPPVIFFQQDNDRLKQGRITIEEFRTIYRIIAHREEIIEIFNAYSENRKILFERNLIDFLTQEQYSLDINRSIVYEIIQKYEPIEEGMLVFQSFIKYLQANFFKNSVTKFKVLTGSHFFWVILDIGSFNFVFGDCRCTVLKATSYNHRILSYLVVQLYLSFNCFYVSLSVQR